MKKLIILFLFISSAVFGQVNLKYVNTVDSFEIRELSTQKQMFQFDAAAGITFPDRTTLKTADGIGAPDSISDTYTANKYMQSPNYIGDTSEVDLIYNTAALSIKAVNNVSVSSDNADVNIDVVNQTIKMEASGVAGHVYLLNQDSEVNIRNNSVEINGSDYLELYSADGNINIESENGGVDVMSLGVVNITSENNNVNIIADGTTSISSNLNIIIHDNDSLRADGTGESTSNNALFKNFFARVGGFFGQLLEVDTAKVEALIIAGSEPITGTSTSKYVMENTLTDSLTTVKLKADTVMEYITKSTVSGDEGIAIVGGQLSVGSHDEPHEFVAGGGDSYVDGLVVFQTPDDIVYTDQTSKAIVLNDPYPSFGGTAIGQTVYFGSDTTWVGFKINTSTLVNPGTGDVIREYYDGDSWEQFTVMATDANSLESRANSVGSVIGSEQVRLGGLVDAAKVSINDSIKYYIRFRISSAITSDGTTDQVKIHSDRFEINATGQTENFGQAIYKRPLGIHLTTTAEIDGLAPKDGTIDYTTTYSLKQKKNRLEDGVLDGSGGIITIPDGLDTSKDLEFYINYKVDAASSGNIEFELEATQFEVGDLVDGTTTPGQQLSNIQTIAINEENTIKQLVFKLDIEELLPGEFVEYVYFRDASAGNTNDTYPDDLSIISFNVVGFFWKP